MKFNLDILIDEFKKFKDIKLVSFDIFDTILFRLTHKPTDVFTVLAFKAKEKGILFEYIADETFKNIRVEAEKQARFEKKKKQQIPEVTLEEIYNYMPNITMSKNSLMRLELETEQELCYINPVMKEFIEYLLLKGIKIILTSDMYLKKDEIVEIFYSNNMDLSSIENVFVSCEYQKSKSSGSLYEFIINQYNTAPENILHIGDNYSSDIVSAQSYGINTIYYDAISSMDTQELQLEQLKYGKAVPEIYSLRKYILSQKTIYTGDKEKWYQLGACVIAPLLTAAVEWTLDIAEENNVKNIYPLMREGKLLGSMLKQSLLYRKENIEVRPLYVSRKALLLPSLDKYDDEILKDILNIRRIKVKDVFHLLCIDELMTPFEKYKDDEVRETRAIDYNSSTVGKTLESYLLSEDVTAQILKSIRLCSERCYGYFEQMGLTDANYITIDLGFRGTIQTGIELLLKKFGVSNQNINLLICGSQHSVSNLMKDINIRGFIGTCGDNADLLNLITSYPFIFEQIMMCQEGTTVGYKEIDNEIVPVTKQLDTISEEQFKNIKYCQEGILEYQKQYLELASKKQRVKDIVKNNRGLTNIICRLLTAPSHDEASILSKLTHDENYGVDEVYKICQENHINIIKEHGLEYFYSKVSPRDVLWLEGLQVLVDPMYFFNKVVDLSDLHQEKSILRMVKKIADDEVDSIVIIGAGEAGRQVQRYLQLYNIKVESFVDNNKKLQGHMIENIPVKSMDDAFESSNFIIASFAYLTELKKQAEERFGNGIKLYYQGM